MNRTVIHQFYFVGIPAGIVLFGLFASKFMHKVSQWHAILYIRAARWILPFAATESRIIMEFYSAFTAFEIG